MAQRTTQLKLLHLFLRKKMILLLLLNELSKKRKRTPKKDCIREMITKKRKTKRRRRWWVRPAWRTRLHEGEYHTVMRTMRNTDPESFRHLYRMTPSQFDMLSSMVHDKLKKYPRNRIPLSPSERLAMTLRYLASGAAITAIALAFRVGMETCRVIIHETCSVIYNLLQPVYLKEPNQELWEDKSKQFWNRWQFPNCVGAAGGKHVTIQCPAKARSSYHNAKGSFAIILMAVADACYKFTYVDIGEHEHQSSDWRTFASSFLERAVKKWELVLPTATCLPNSTVQSPYIFVGDDAFALSTYLMRPFPEESLDSTRAVYNYRLSRARRCVENAFGILAARWRIFRRPMNLLPNRASNVIRAALVLHNYLIADEENLLPKDRLYCPAAFADTEDMFGNVITGQWHADLEAVKSVNGLTTLPSISDSNFSRNSIEIRENFKSYFNSDIGEVPWQWAISTS